jgi:hypothetical protein
VAATITRAGSPVEYLGAPELRRRWDADPRRMIEAVRQIGEVD